MAIDKQKLSVSVTAITLITPLAVTSCSKKDNKKEKTKPMNIVYIMSDDHSFQTISCYDTRYIKTPNIDRIANEGVRFTESFVANSLSGPSRACMLTGKHSHINGKTNNEHGHEFDQYQETMPKVLHNAGYQTCMIGKIHLDGIPQGFDYWCILPGQGDYYNPKFVLPQGNPLDPEGKTDTVETKGYVTDIITDKSLEWLDHRDKSKPFAIFIHHKASHRNWMPDTLDLKAFENVEYKLPDNYFDNYKGREAASKQEMEITRDLDPVYDLKLLKDAKHTRLYNLYLGIYNRLPEDVKQKFDSLYNPISKYYWNANLKGEALAQFKFNRYMRDYSKVLLSLDRNIGRVYDYLKEHDLLDNTLIVYTSDQGFYMGEHGWFDKRFMYEESMRTPLVMRLPKGYNKRGDVTELVQNIDYAPTFIDMAGIKVPDDMQGKSLVPLLKDNKPVKNWDRKGLYYHFYEYPGEHQVRRHYGIRGTRYKLIHFYGDIDKWELYDLKTDPHEMNNLYDNSEYKHIADSMKIELNKLEVQYKAENAR